MAGSASPGAPAATARVPSDAPLLTCMADGSFRVLVTAPITLAHRCRSGAVHTIRSLPCSPNAFVPNHAPARRCRQPEPGRTDRAPTPGSGNDRQGNQSAPSGTQFASSAYAQGNAEDPQGQLVTGASKEGCAHILHAMPP